MKKLLTPVVVLFLGVGAAAYAERAHHPRVHHARVHHGGPIGPGRYSTSSLAPDSSGPSGGFYAPNSVGRGAAPNFDFNDPRPIGETGTG
jgi:hypothetical protein